MKKYNPFHRVLKALGLADLPSAITVGRRHLRHVRTFKHDFFAVTGLYADDAGQVVLKVGRAADAVGLPAAWIGRWLTFREAAFYATLDGLPGIPAYLGIWRGRVGRWRALGFVHEFAPGHPLQRYERPGDGFFDELARLLGQIHAHGFAYVDLNKRENILVGDDGRPYLIDFQISFRGGPVLGWLTGVLQRGDLYHFCKHKRRHRPDLCSAKELDQAVARSVWINLHRTLTRPLQTIRRGALKRVDPAHQSERTRLEG